MKKWILLFLLMCAPVFGLTTETWYVWPDAAGSADGTSWANAYTTLDGALGAKKVNLVTADKVMNFKCKVTSTSDTTAVSEIGYTCDATRYIKIDSDDRTYILSVSNATAFDVPELKVVMNGLTIKTAAINADSQYALSCGSMTGDPTFTADQCTFVGAGDADNYQSAVYINDGGGTFTFRNCLMYNVSTYDNAANCGVTVNAATAANFYNCTISGGKYAIRGNNTSGITAKNCLFLDQLTSALYDFSSTILTRYCMGESAWAADTEEPSGNWGESAEGFDVTATFRLNVGSNGIDDGEDLSGDGITVDIDNQSRSGTYDIGCDEYVVATTARRRAIRW